MLLPSTLTLWRVTDFSSLGMGAAFESDLASGASSAKAGRAARRPSIRISANFFMVLSLFSRRSARGGGVVELGEVGLHGLQRGHVQVDHVAGLVVAELHVGAQGGIQSQVIESVFAG